MTKWFDTNYHYMVPEFTGIRLSAFLRKPVEEYQEAKALGYQTRPVLLGPVTFLKLGKTPTPASIRCRCCDRLLPVYIEVLRELAKRGAPNGCRSTSPVLVLDLDEAARDALAPGLRSARKEVPGSRSC